MVSASGCEEQIVTIWLKLGQSVPPPPKTHSANKGGGVQGQATIKRTSFEPLSIVTSFFKDFVKEKEQKK